MKPPALIAASYQAGALVEREAWKGALERLARHLESNGQGDAALTVRLYGSVELRSRPVVTSVNTREYKEVV